MEKKVVMHSSQGRWYIVKIKEKRDSITEPYDDIKYQVQAEYMRFEADRILRDYINNLKDNAAIKIIDQYDE
jgi:parvulin-like peptidyl-prolyl isomerase